MTLYEPIPARHSAWTPTIRVNIAACLASLIVVGLLFNEMLGSLAALIFLGSGLLLMASNLANTLLALSRAWYVLPLPLYCTLSTLWSQAPSETFRGGLQLLVSLAIAIVMAFRVTPRTLVRILFGSLLLTMIASALFGRVQASSGAWVGIFGSKNAFAAAASTLMLVSIAAFADQTGSAYQRIIAVVSLVVSVPMLVLAQSAGSLITVMPGIGVMILVLSGRWLTGFQRIVLICALAMAATIGFVLVAAYWTDLMSLMLSTTGKDVTLTGRTELWRIAIDIIAGNPLFGVGYRAFWIQGYAPAETLWAAFQIETRAGFHFHNTYISNAVEIGWVGVAMQALLLLGALVLTLRWSLVSPSPANAFFAAYLTTTLISTMVEVPIFFQFSLPSTLIVIALIYGARATKS